MKKIILALAALATCAFAGKAADFKHSLVVNKTDGSMVEYLFSTQPVATIEGDDLRITVASTGATVLYPLSEFVNMTINAYDPSGVNPALEENLTPSFAITETALEAQGLPQNAYVAIYDTAGALRAQGRADSLGALSIAIANLPKGVYVVAAGNNNFKFIR